MERDIKKIKHAPILFLGDSKTGKSSILHCYQKEAFDPKQKVGATAGF